MSDYVRYAIYYLPPAGPLAAFGAEWLGWDVQTGRSVPQPAVEGIADATRAPRKYGFHGTLKAPFRLAPGETASALRAATSRMAAALAPVRVSALVLRPLGRFLASVPDGPAPDLADLASRCVTDLDPFRAPLTQADLDRRRAAGLIDRQDALLQRWGYPYVMEEFRFHMTLTGRLDPAPMAQFRAEIAARLPALPTPYAIDRIALAGERPDGRFEAVHDYTLAG